MARSVFSLREILLTIVALAVGIGAGMAFSGFWSRPPSVVVQLPGAGPAGAPIRVYVSGAVHNPGVYPLQTGDRVIEAVEAAGGPAGDADTEAVNFAQKLQDEEHLRVPRIGEPAAPPTVTGSSQGVQRVDINHADAGLLRSLPGIGEARAAAIVTSRQQQGLFRRPEELLDRRLLTPTQFTGVKELIEAIP